MKNVVFIPTKSSFESLLSFCFSNVQYFSHFPKQHHVKQSITFITILRELLSYLKVFCVSAFSTSSSFFHFPKQHYVKQSMTFITVFRTSYIHMIWFFFLEERIELHSFSESNAKSLTYEWTSGFVGTRPKLDACFHSWSPHVLQRPSQVLFFHGQAGSSKTIRNCKSSSTRRETKIHRCHFEAVSFSKP